MSVSIDFYAKHCFEICFAEFRISYHHFNMEVDEIDTGLLEQFGSLQTVDHADLIRQMRKLVGGEESISETCAQFYLEMSNWNGKTINVNHVITMN